MFSAAVSRRRLAAAVTVTLAVTLGATTLNAPAFAAPAAGTTAASTQANPVDLYRADVPAVADLDRPGPFPISWILSGESSGTIEVEHVKTHVKMSRSDMFADATNLMEFDLQGRSDEGGALPTGDYVWKVEVTPSSGGALQTWTGKFKIVRKAQPHDFNDNGSPDLLARDGSGTLWRHEADGKAFSAGTGWGVYDRIEAAGNLGGTAVGDVVARDRGGYLWLHKGQGYFYGTFTNGRIRIGSGWNAYTILAGGSDVTGDGRPDLLGVDGHGVLRVHTGTGNDLAPFAPGRKSAGMGWGVYNEIAAVGNIAGGPAGDLVARDRNGVLWLHLGKGDGTFAPRTRIGGGWNAYTQLVGAGDANHDGHPDLIAYNTNGDGDSAVVYKSTGSWKTPFTTPEQMTLYVNHAPYDTVA